MKLTAKIKLTPDEWLYQSLLATSVFWAGLQSISQTRTVVWVSNPA